MSTRVDATSRKPPVSRRRIAWPSRTSSAAVAGLTPASMRDDLLFDFVCRETEFDRHHALPGRVLEILQHALVARVVRHHQAESRGSVQRHAEPFDRQLPPVVGERVQHDGGVLSRFHHLVEIADGTLAHGPGQRAVDPHRLAAPQQIPADQVRGREVVVAGHGDQRPAQVVGHRLDEAGLAAAGRTLEHQGQTLPVGRLEDGFLVADRLVEGAASGARGERAWARRPSLPFRRPLRCGE